MTRPCILVPTLVLAALLGGCRGFIDRQAADSTYRILSKSQEAARRQADIELARDALPGGIMQLETFSLAYPHHGGFKRMHAEAVCQYAVAFVFDDWEDAQLGGRADEATRLAARTLQLVTTCRTLHLELLPPPGRTAYARGGDAWTAFVGRAGASDVPALLWIATADAVMLAIEPIRNLGKLATGVRTPGRGAALKPGQPRRQAQPSPGQADAAPPPAFGGPDGRARFDQARKQLGSGALMVDVLFARGPLVAAKDRVRFQATLRAVVDADLTRWPERRLSNELARRKAARYLAAIDRLVSQ